MAFPQVVVVDHRANRERPIKVVRVRATDSVRHWSGRTRDTDPATSEVARYPMSWHDIEQDGADFVVRKREEQRDPRDVRDQTLVPGAAGPLRQNSEPEHDIARDILGHADPAARIRARQARERTHDSATLHSMNARNKAFWSGRGGR
jgi:hypothetical protein